MRQVPSSLALLDRFPFLVPLYLFVGALSISCLIPLYSSYVVTELGEPAWKLAVYIAGSTVITLFSNRYFGAKIDAGTALKPILLLCTALYTVNMGLQSAVPTYWMLLLGIPFMGVSGGTLSTTFSLGRLFAEQTNRDPARFNSHMRISMSLGWMIGTPIAFTLYGIYGINSIFPTAGGLAILWLIMGVVVVPNGFKTHHPIQKTQSKAIEPVPLPLLLACLPIFALTAANVTFVSAGPVFFIEEMGFPTATPGLAFSVKCLVEVFAIYLVVKPAQKFGDRNLMMLSALLGTLFFFMIVRVTDPTQVYLLCALEGLYYGINVGIGLTYIQSYAPHRPGIATAYYVNAIFAGGLVGNMITGTVASVTTFQNTIQLSAVTTMLAAAILLFIRPPNPQVALHPSQP
ncbi:MFS transporter [Pseudovibrio sp. Tun.PSC04-5.I4]|uniref:MFS transporter n=1 Tax=Pseudovibrio sp. Tun.PSC04-5.I4 TaxID=1798213 RepID=UPI00088C8308|nr:MFS transporter [Pseudovibrio sp. Tun.PSC04-5.I4]SDR36267.1 MFS transporter, SET family, sugar efflux transporter [Pseudovibrio sp. Tun.PSC04-5.I4]